MLPSTPPPGPRRRSATVAVLVALVAGPVLSACGAPEPGAGGPVPLTVWRHVGTAEEDSTFAAQVADYNRSPGAAGRVVVRSIAEGDYNDTVQAAGAAAALPDIVEVDGPNVSSYAYEGLLTPLDDLLPTSVLDDQLPSLVAQNSRQGHRWSVGTFDSGLGLFASRKALERAGVRIPTGPADAWTGREFTGVLRALARHDPDRRVLDLKRNYGAGEWLTYGFAPLVASAGGSLLGPEGAASGTLDGPATTAALGSLRSWSRFVDPDEDDAALPSGRVALSWVGHWAYPGYHRALGDDLLVLPLPDLGSGTKTGQGSWAWGISAPEERRAAAADFLRFLLGQDEVLRMTEANAAVPGTRSALARSPLYGSGGPLRLFADQLVASCGHTTPDRSCVAVPRPQTPGYPALTSVFAHAVDVALRGEDPAPALRDAARLYDEDRRASSFWR